ncbi:MAG: hypothetical protein ABFS45_09475 [Pseudomonadota bacterium]
MANVTIENTAGGKIVWFIYNRDDAVEWFALRSGPLGQGKTYTAEDVGGDGTGYTVNIHYDQEQTKFNLPESGGTVRYPG